MESATAPQSLTVAHGAGNWGKLTARILLLKDGTLCDFRSVDDSYWSAMRRHHSRAGTPNIPAVMKAAKALYDSQFVLGQSRLLQPILFQWTLLFLFRVLHYAI